MDHPALSAFVRWCAVSMLALVMAWVPDEAAAFGITGKKATLVYGPVSVGGVGCSGTSTSLAGIMGACVQQKTGYPMGGGPSACQSGGNGSFQCTCMTGPTGGQAVACSYLVATQHVCPADSVDVPNVGCRCRAGFRVGPNADEPCEPYTCEAGSLATVHSQQTSGLSLEGCYDGCKVKAQMVSQGSDGRYWTGGDHRETGEQCEGSTSSDGDSNVPPSPPDDGVSGVPNTCTGAMQCPVVLSDRTICIPCTKTTQGDEGKTTETKVNPDGSTTETTTQTECTGGKCTTTTTTTTKDPSGNATGTTTTTTENPIGKFCQENPKSPLCAAEEENESSFGGACGGGFQCKGDAVQCAIAKEQHQRNCEMFVTPTPMSQAGVAAANGEARPQGHPLNDQTATPFDFASGINTSDALGGGGSCPSDVTLTVSSLALTIPWSRYCDMLNTIGTLSVAVCMLAAALIVFRS